MAAPLLEPRWSWSEVGIDVNAETVVGSSVVEDKNGESCGEELDLALLFPECVFTPGQDVETVATDAPSGATEMIVRDLLQAQQSAELCNSARESAVAVTAAICRRSSFKAAQQEEEHEQAKMLNLKLEAQRQEIEAQLTARLAELRAHLDDRVSSAVSELSAAMNRRSEAAESQANHMLANVENRLNTFVNKLETLITRQRSELKSSSDASAKRLQSQLDDLKANLAASEESTREDLKKLERVGASLEQGHLILDQRIGSVDAKICTDMERSAKLEQQLQSDFVSFGERLQEQAQRLEAQETGQDSRFSQQLRDLESSIEQRLLELDNKFQSGLGLLQKETHTASDLAKTCLWKFDTRIMPSQDTVQGLHGMCEQIAGQVGQSPLSAPSQVRVMRRPESACTRAPPGPQRPARPSSAKSTYGRPIQSVQSCQGRTAVADERVQCCNEFRDSARPAGAVKEDVRLFARNLLADSVVMSMEMGPTTPAGAGLLAARAQRPS